jgi:hypothetical protein
MPDVIVNPSLDPGESAIVTVVQPDDPTVKDSLPVGVVTRLSIYMVVMGGALIYLLLKLWPGKVPPGDLSTISLGWNGGAQINLWIETRYILIVTVAGAIGSYIHVATSFADFVGNRKLRPSWEIWYMLRPFIGAFLSIVVYFVIRGGLMSSTSGADQMSPYGLAATACMCGLFSKQASDKLQEIFEEAFRTRKPVQRNDPLEPELQTIEIHSGGAPNS